jgi:hypothetical protein
MGLKRKIEIGSYGKISKMRHCKPSCKSRNIKRSNFNNTGSIQNSVFLILRWIKYGISFREVYM